MSTHKCDFYVQIVPNFSKYGGHDTVTGVRAIKMTQTKPTRTEPNAQVVKLTLEIDEDLFIHKTPTIQVKLDANNINSPRVVDQHVIWNPDDEL